MISMMQIMANGDETDEQTLLNTPTDNNNLYLQPYCAELCLVLTMNSSESFAFH